MPPLCSATGRLAASSTELSPASGAKQAALGVFFWGGGVSHDPRDQRLQPASPRSLQETFAQERALNPPLNAPIN